MKRNEKNLKPLIKYPGGKSDELDCIYHNAPEDINNYIEPFLGGGAVYFSVKANHYLVNDISEDLMLLYNYVRTNDKEFFNELDLIVRNWESLGGITNDSYKFFYKELINFKSSNINSKDLKDEISNYVDNIENLDQPLFQLDEIRIPIFKQQLVKNMVSIIKRINRNEKKKNQLLTDEEIKNNFECAVKSSYYMYFRELYNYPELYILSRPRKVAIFLFIREYCYSSMFRFNKEGKFNVPYGGISYNKKSLLKKIEYYRSKELKNHLNETEFHTQDFYDFVNEIVLQKNDFMFLDPPYDTTFSEYDQNKFDKADQKRLSDYLINNCPCKFMLIIKKTPYIESLYLNKGLNIKETDKNYFVSFKNRNKKNVTHLIITNY